MRRRKWRRKGRTFYRSTGRLVGVFYVQDERYATGAWMRWSGDVHDERVGTCSCSANTPAILGGRMPRAHGDGMDAGGKAMQEQLLDALEWRSLNRNQPSSNAGQYGEPNLTEAEPMESAVKGVLRG